MSLLKKISGWLFGGVPKYALNDRGENKLSSFTIQKGRYKGTEFVMCFQAHENKEPKIIIELLSNPKKLPSQLPRGFQRTVSRILNDHASKNASEETLCKRH